MKGILVSLILSFNLMAIPIAQAETVTKNDIYSDDYPNDYDVWVDSAFINRLLNELTKELDFEFNLDEITISSSESNSPLIEFNNTLENGFRSIWFIIGDESIYFQILGYSDNLNKMGFDTYLEKLVYILAPDMEGNIVADAMNKLQNFDFYDSDGAFEFHSSDGFRFIVSDNAKEGEFFLSVNRKFDDYELLYKELIERKEFKEKYTFLEIDDYNSYLDIDYTDIMGSEKKMFDNHTFSAEVLQYIQNTDLNSASAFLIRDGNANQIYQAYFPELYEKNFERGDEVIIFGSLSGKRSYETVANGELTMPLIFVHELRLVHD